VNNSDKIFDLLTTPGERLPALMEWLHGEVWSSHQFRELNPTAYLEEGERLVHRVEEVVLAAAPALYDEITAASLRTPNVMDLFLTRRETAVVIFDGASIRELPLFEYLATSTGFEIIESRYSVAALPSDTEYFVEQRILGKRLAPSQLPGRQELRERGITALYYDAPIRTFDLQSSDSFLLWSHFPDGTYKDLSARFSSHFGEMRNLFDTVWKNIILTIPREYDIIITSDHGYIFFGPELESTAPTDAARMLNHDRFRFFAADEPLPSDVPELQLLGDRRLAMLRGRIKNRPQGPSGNKAYRHGGMSLMEMLTPWLVLKRI